MVSPAKTTSYTPGLTRTAEPSARMTSTSLSVGSTRYDGGRISGVTLCTISGESAKRSVNSS